MFRVRNVSVCSSSWKLNTEYSRLYGSIAEVVAVAPRGVLVYYWVFSLFSVVVAPGERLEVLVPTS